VPVLPAFSGKALLKSAENNPLLALIVLPQSCCSTGDERFMMGAFLLFPPTPFERMVGAGREQYLLPGTADLLSSLLLTVQ
jgi:hypothetical protein